MEINPNSDKSSTSDQKEKRSETFTQTKEEKKAGIWQSFAIFFHRHFSSITEIEKHQAEEIKELIAKVKSDIEKTSTLDQQYKIKLSDKTPSEVTVSYGLDYLEEMRQLASHAEEDLNELKSHEKLAEELAKNHAAFDSLPKEIQALDGEIHYIKDKIKIKEKLMDLEQTIEDYSNQKTWEQFTAIYLQKGNLGEALKEVVSRNDSFANDRAIHQYLSKPSLTMSECYQLMALTFPGLAYQAERLFDHMMVLNQERVINLNGQAESIKPVLLKYRNQALHIDHLENQLNSPTLMNKIFRFFQKPDKLNDKIKEAKEEIKNTYEEIKTKGSFNPEELDWLREKAKTNSDRLNLDREIGAIQTTIHFIDTREHLAHKMDYLINILVQYQANKTAFETEADPKTKELLEDLKNKINLNMQSIYKIVQQRENVGNNSVQNVEISPLAQMKRSVIRLFPTLRNKTNALFNLIEKLDMQSELNQYLRN